MDTPNSEQNLEQLPELIHDTTPLIDGTQAPIWECIRSKMTVRRAIGMISTVLAVSGAAKIATYEYETHTTVTNNNETLANVPNILAYPDTVPSATANKLNPTSIVPSKGSDHESRPDNLPELLPHEPSKLIIPKLHIDAQIDPVSTPPTGKKNKWGGEIYQRIDFPVDKDARYWVQGGLPNTLTGVTYEEDPKAVQRTVIYGHASDIGYHLLFQDLQSLELGDTFSLVAGQYEFTYTVYNTSNPSKSGLAEDSQVYNLPANGRKEVALVACLPDSASHSVRIGYLSKVLPLKKTD